MTYQEWEARYPEAAAAFGQVINSAPWPAIPSGGDGKSEAWAQQRVRLNVAHAGAMAWRNNVGATPAKCEFCGEKLRPLRYGLANDSAQLNKRIKSSDLILAIPRRITPAMVGTVIAQFGAIETKRPGWQYTGEKQEPAQAAWLGLVQRIGGYAGFSTGEVAL